MALLATADLTTSQLLSLRAKKCIDSGLIAQVADELHCSRSVARSALRQDIDAELSAYYTPNTARVAASIAVYGD